MPKVRKVRPDNELVPFNFRTTERLYGMIAKAAEESGRSINGELVYRLEKSMWKDEMFLKLGNGELK